MLGIQLGIGSFAAVRGVSPNLLLLMVIFIALNAPREQALLGAFLLGAMQDLTTVQPLGLFAFSYGLVAILVTWAAQFVRRAHPLTQLSMTFAASLLVGFILLVHDLIHPIPPDRLYGGTMTSVAKLGPRVLLVSTIYTTALSPIAIGILQQLQGLFAFDPIGRRRSRV